jgi:pimeloyl-ACP methyl ester carboxylesterase
MLQRTMESRLARKFLYIVAGLIVLAIAATFAYRIWGMQLLRQAMIPGARFEAQAALPQDSYARREMWLARPDLANNPAMWLPEGMKPAEPGRAAVFAIHPTSYLDRARWNAPLDNQEANDRAKLFLRGQGSAFNAAGAIWAPRYRQATFGAFLTASEDAQAALDLAYRDVAAAFEQFLKEAGDRPIILTGHSQGALHLTRLLRERIAGQPVAKRIVAAYVVGWPVSKTADLPLMGLAECTRADQTGCILSWQSFAEPADPSLILDTFDATTGFTGASRANTAMICTNPITGTPADTAPAAANLGTLVPSSDFATATIQTGSVGARCDGRGILLIGEPPAALGNSSYVLPGNNYHVFDYSLFWANIRADAARRLAAFE